jgi:hypothetical protein
MNVPATDRPEAANLRQRLGVTYIALIPFHLGSPYGTATLCAPLCPLHYRDAYAP